jgi:hypothetical protein
MFNLRAGSGSCLTPTYKPPSTTQACHPDGATAAVEANDQARVDGLRTALAALAVALSGLFFARAIQKARE